MFRGIGGWGLRCAFGCRGEVGVKCTHISAGRRRLSVRLRTLGTTKYRGVFSRGVAKHRRGHPRLSTYLDFLQRNSALIMCGLSQLNHSLGGVLALLRSFGGENVRFASLRSGVDARNTVNRLVGGVLNTFTRFRESLVCREARRNEEVTGRGNIGFNEGALVGGGGVTGRGDYVRLCRSKAPMERVRGVLGVNDDKAMCHLLEEGKVTLGSRGGGGGWQVGLYPSFGSSSRESSTVPPLDGVVKGSPSQKLVFFGFGAVAPYAPMPLFPVLLPGGGGHPRCFQDRAARGLRPSRPRTEPPHFILFRACVRRSMSSVKCVLPISNAHACASKCSFPRCQYMTCPIYRAGARGTHGDVVPSSWRLYHCWPVSLY